MATLRNLNVLDQMRLDVPHFRLVESAVRGDFDVAIGQIAAGGQPFVVRGLTIAGSGRADTLELVVADAIAINYNATHSGSFIHIPADEPNQVLNGTTNGRVDGAFVEGVFNYVGIDFVRTTDPDSADLVTFVNPTTGVRTQSQVETAEYLTYRIVIGTTPFSVLPNIVPVAKITVTGGVATIVEDARPMLFRLGTGGDFPSNEGSYSWPQDRNTSLDFTGGDKAIASQKDWLDAVMTRIWEIGGGANWYTNTADRNVWSINTESPFSNGDYWTFDAGTGNTEFKNIRFFFTGAGVAYYNDIVGTGGTPFVLADGYGVYADLDRTANVTVGYGVAPIANIGTGSIPGARWILAWRNGSNLYTRNWRFPVGVTYTPATNLALGVVKLHAVAGTPLFPVVPVFQTGNIIELTYGTSSLTSPGFGFGLTPASSVAAGTGGDAAFFTGVSSDAGSGGRGLVSEGGSGSGALNRGGTGVKGVGGVGYLGAGEGVGVHGSSSSHWGVWGESTSGTGVAGTSSSGNGVAGTAAGVGNGVYGAASGVGAGLRGSGTSGAGVNGSSTTGTGVIGSSGTGIGVSGLGGTDNTGVFGLGDGTGHGVYGEGGSSGSGVWGVSTGTGVGGKFEHTTGASHALTGTAIGGTGHGVLGTASGTGSGVAGSNSGGYGLESVAGNVGCEASYRYRFTNLKTGVVIIPAVDWEKIGGSAVLSTFDANLDLPYYTLTSALTGHFLTSIRIPRGANITSLELLVKNSSGAENVAKPALRLVQYTTAAAATSPTPLTPGGTFSVATGAGNPVWTSIGAITAATAPAGTTGNLNSGVYVLDWNPSSTVSSNLYVGGWRVTYEYVTVDFMV